jgi:anti-sigma factor RsiW
LLLRRLDGELAADAAKALDAHIAECAECRDRWSRLRSISGALNQYSVALVAPAPAGSRQALLAAMRGRRDASAKRTYAMIAAAVLILAVGIGFLVLRPPVTPARAPHMASDAFIDLPYSDENLSGEGAVVLQVELPRSAVALAGIPVSDGPADGRVKAEVLVGADGLARAIRFRD